MTIPLAELSEISQRTTLDGLRSFMGSSVQVIRKLKSFCRLHFNSASVFLPATLNTRPFHVSDVATRTNSNTKIAVA